MLNRPMDIGDEGLQFLLELHVIVWAPQSSLIAELEEGNPAHVTDLLVKFRKLFGGLPDPEGSRRATSLGSLTVSLGLIEVDTGMILTQMDLSNIARLQLSDVKHRLLVALLTPHESTLLQNLHQNQGPPTGQDRKTPDRLSVASEIIAVGCSRQDASSSQSLLSPKNCRLSRAAAEGPVSSIDHAPSRDSGLCLGCKPWQFVSNVC
jgi:hypothetical protein